MRDDDSDLDADARRVIAEEESLFACVSAALQEARERAPAKAAANELRSIDSLRALRDEAIATSEDDLPTVLLEMSVRQRLIERPAAPALPDPNAPYLAHLRVNEGNGSLDYLLGHVTFVDVRAGVRIVDWRVAPVAQIFYRYREGDEYEEVLPGRTAAGVIEARRIVVIEGGVLVRVVSDALVVTRGDSGRWRVSGHAGFALALGGAGAAARPGALGVGVGVAERAASAAVTATLDPDQYAAVCAPPEQPLLVLGSAGSGKTTVALHRLARVAAIDPERYPLSNVKVVVPAEGLARLSRRLLEPLGAGAASVATLDAWSLTLASEVFGRRITLSPDAPAGVIALKRHPALFRALQERFAQLKAAQTTFARLRRHLTDAFADRTFLERVVDVAAGDVSRSAIDATIQRTRLQLAEPLAKELESIVVPERKTALDGRPLWEGTPDELAGTLDAEDLPILLFLRAWRGAFPAQPIAHLVLDEAEDFSLFDLFVLGKFLSTPCSVTLAGDQAQQTASSFAGWEATLDTVGVRDAATCRLSISYRCPAPVAELAQRLLGSLAPERPAQAARDGAPVGFFHFPTPAQAHLFLSGALRDLVEREPRASVGVIAHDAATAQQFHALIAEVPTARLVLAGEFSFEAGIDVTDVDSAKGLEFDYVVVPDATAEVYPLSSDSRRRLHVAVTRAAHQLWVVSGGRRTPLLAAITP